MTRYRPPRPSGSAYITPAGYRRLRDELDDLWRVKRPAVTQSVREAAAQGDRSENAEYIYGKKQLREIDQRVRFLRQRLEALTVVDSAPSDTARVFFGAWVTLEDVGGQEICYRIVGPDEIADAPAYISLDSPVARALLGKHLDDEVRVAIPGGEIRYIITAIRYAGGPGAEE